MSPPKSTIAQCSFCKRPRNEVKGLISASDEGPFICNRCIDQGFKAFTAEQKKEQAAKENEAPLKKPVEIKSYLDERVIAQDKAKTDVSIAIYNHYRRREALRQGVDLGDVEIEKSNILLMGPSGTGKTHIARALAKMLNVPFFVGDATKLTAAGYVGDDVESLLQGLMQEAGGDMERAQWGIVLIDEFDKIARKSGRGATGYRDVGGEMVQQAILKLLEGSKVPVPRGNGMRVGMGGAVDVMDTTNVLFICAGSFAGIEEVISKRVNRHTSLGFGSVERVKLSGSETYLSVTEEDVLEFGLIPEVMGRLPVLTTTIDLTEGEMVQILTEPKNAIIRQFKALFGLDGIDLQFDEAALKAIGREAKKRPTGARALRSIVESILQPYSFESRSQPNIKAIRITEEVVEKKGKAVIVTKEPKTVKQASG
jgi:ATP-dependent Clp protease ATP-binding subunit ClpX